MLAFCLIGIVLALREYLMNTNPAQIDRIVAHFGGGVIYGDDSVLALDPDYQAALLGERSRDTPGFCRDLRLSMKTAGRSCSRLAGARLRQCSICADFTNGGNRRRDEIAALQPALASSWTPQSIGAPSSTTNADEQRDPEMHQTRKGRQWFLGMKLRIGEDSMTGLAHVALRRGRQYPRKTSVARSAARRRGTCVRRLRVRLSGQAEPE